MGKGNRIEDGCTVGLDVSDRFIQVCVLDAAGVVRWEGRVRTEPRALNGFFRRPPPVRVALEAGGQSAWMARLLESLGHEVIVANARKLRLIYQNNQKSDRADAEYLARLARADPALLHPVRHRSEAAQVDLALLRSRDVLVAARTKLICSVRAQLKVFGARAPACSTAAFAARARPMVPEALAPALLPLIEEAAHLSEQIRAYDKKAEALCREIYPHSALLRQVAGVGPLTALCFLLTIDDPARFQKSREVGPYLGLVPRKDDSGEHCSQLGITKAGNRQMRRLLVQAAHYILGPFGPDTELRRHGERIAERGGARAKKRATIAVARKLAVLLHRLWVTGQVYDPLPKEALKAAAA